MTVMKALTNRDPLWRWVLVISLAAMSLVGLTLVNLRLTANSPGGNDFLARWVGANAWVVDGMNPYDPQVSLRSQILIYGRPADPEQGEDIAHFVYPLPSMIFFAPFGALSYEWARPAWMTLLEISLPLLVLFGLQIVNWRPPPWLLAILLLFSLLWYHGVRTLILGQFAALDAVLIIGALLAIKQGKDPLVGVLLSLSTVKPQMPFLIIPFVLLWAISVRRWRIITWFIGAFLGIYGLSVLLLPVWPQDWLRQLLDYPSYTNLGSPVSILVNPILGLPNVLTGILSLLIVLYLLWEWRRAWAAPMSHFQWTATLTLVATNLIAFRTATTNYVVLLPALLMSFQMMQARWGRQGMPAILVAILVLTIGLWMLFIVTVEGNVESSWMYLPLPFLTLLGILWSRSGFASMPENHAHGA